MRKSAIFVFAAILPLSAANMLFSGLPCWDVEGGIDAIYWRPCEEGVTYAYYSDKATTNDFGTSEQAELQPGYGWGFRLYGGISDPCTKRFAELEWVHLNDTSSAMARNNRAIGQLRSSVPAPEFSGTAVETAAVSQHNRYNHVALRVGQAFCADCRGHLFAYLGGSWRGIHVRNNIKYGGVDPTAAAEPSSSVAKLNVSMGSVDYGLGAVANLGCGFDVDVRMGSFIGVGELFYFFQLDATFNDVPGRDQSISPTQTHCIAGLELDASVGYVYECSCASIRGQIGYRIDYYIGIETRLSFSDEDGPTTATFRGYAGPYIGIAVQY